jgi:putative ABC transport system permease protein
VTGTPRLGTSDGMPFSIDGQPVKDAGQRDSARFQSVTPEYFKTFGIKIMSRRAFTGQDSAASTPVAVVNQEFVKQYFKKENPVGRRLVIEQNIPGLPKLGPAVEWEIIGVFHNVRSFGPRNEVPEIDVPFLQSLLPSVTIGVRTTTNPEALVRTMTSTIDAIDLDIALAQVRSMEFLKDTLFVGDRFVLLLYGSFALLALALAAVGYMGNCIRRFAAYARNWTQDCTRCSRNKCDAFDLE